MRAAFSSQRLSLVQIAKICACSAKINANGKWEKREGRLEIGDERRETENGQMENGKWKILDRRSANVLLLN